ncbi:MAG: hypothetical protein MI749_15565 [Desulfovibrionales bacterium]|nr:hypothetical protein [Desulfovibrionales bacterium]
MLDINRIIPTVLTKIRTLPVGDSIRIATFKKDRHLTITRQNETMLQLIRHGFTNATYEIEEEKIKKELKQLLKQEFPRSNKVHLTTIKQG